MTKNANEKVPFRGFSFSSRSQFLTAEDVVELTKFRLARLALAQQNLLLVQLMGLQSREARHPVPRAGILNVFLAVSPLTCSRKLDNSVGKFPSRYGQPRTGGFSSEEATALDPEIWAILHYFHLRV